MGEARECTNFEGCRDFETLVGLIYQGPLESVPWKSFLDHFRRVMDAMTVALILRPPSEADRGLGSSLHTTRAGSGQIAPEFGLATLLLGWVG